MKSVYYGISFTFLFLFESQEKNIPFKKSKEQTFKIKNKIGVFLNTIFNAFKVKRRKCMEI